ncbi:MAG: universal stress protein [Proteobacteria bacterium]|nr:universal stress protein [Pseudomonadota bacterium]
MTPKKILVPVDFSYHANGAMRLALALANRWTAHLTVLHVDPLPGVGTVAVEPVFIPPNLFEGLHTEHDAKVEANLREIRDELVRDTGHGVDVTTIRRRSEPVSGIVAYAREWGADLMLMGSQGASGFTHLLLGSTAEKVSRIAPCPVLICGSADDIDEQPRSFRRVVAAIDYSEFSTPVARLAVQFVEPGGLVELVHIAGEPVLSALNASLGGSRDDMLALAESVREAQVGRIEEFSRELDNTDVHIAHYVGSGTPAAAILARAEQSNADLIVLGAHSRAGLSERIIGTVADRVLRHARVPVLLDPEAALSGT